MEGDYEFIKTVEMEFDFARSNFYCTWYCLDSLAGGNDENDLLSAGGDAFGNRSGSLINYLRKDISGIIYRYDLVVGLCAILGGILVIVKVDKLTDLIPAVLGFLVTMSGIMKMQNSVDMLRLGHGTWHVAFAMAIVNIVAGIVLLMNPFEAAQILIMCLGIALVYSGITDLYVTISISRRLSRLKTEIVVAEDDSEE